MFIGREAELKFLNDKYEEYYMAGGVQEKPKLFENFAKENRMHSFPVRRQQTQYSFETFQFE